MITFTKEERILSPNDTMFRMEGMLYATEFMIDPDDELWSFSFIPTSYADVLELQERIERAIMTCRMNAPQHSTRTFRANVEDKQGMIVVSQMYQPKLNITVDHWSQLRDRTGSFQLYLKDTRDGEIFLNSSYLDIDEPVNVSEVKEDLPEEWSDFELL